MFDSIKSLLCSSYIISETAQISNKDMVVIGNGTQIKDYVLIWSKLSKVIIGDNCQINPFTVIYGGSGVTIGNNVMIGPHCVFAAGNHDYKQTGVPMRFAGSISKGPIIIESDVWIGANCTITDGVIIRHGAVVGANSVVTNNVDSYSVVGGVPARPILSRKVVKNQKADYDYGLNSSKSTSNIIINFLTKFDFIDNLRSIVKKLILYKLIIKWLVTGRPVPPPHYIKERTVINFSKRYNIHTFVETGTYKAEMVLGIKDYFRSIYTVELDKKLYDQNLAKVKPFPNIITLRGDSAKEILGIAKEIKSPTIFWLDAHFSGIGTAKAKVDPPIFSELEIVLKRKFDDVIIIDDAHNFIGENGYPSIESLTKLVNQKKPDYMIEVKNNMIILIPSK